MTRHPQTCVAPKVCAVVVTYNRLTLLQSALDALRHQTRVPDRILVVDNGSTDNTGSWLAAEVERDQKNLIRVITQSNLGSSGGVFTGIQSAYRDGFDWFWCLDDDTIPGPSALETLLEGANRGAHNLPGVPIGWLNSVVHWIDGNLHKMNEPKLKPYLSWGPDVLGQRYLPAQWCSFVSVLINRQAVTKCGLPLRDMFIWYDDVEYTARIELAGFAGLVVLDSVVVHRTKSNYAADLEGIDETNRDRYRYAFRNEVLTLRTLHEGRPLALMVRFLRLMLRRVVLMIRAGKFRYLFLAIQQGCEGLTMARRIEIPTSEQPMPSTPVTPAALSESPASSHQA